mmetsp:Transcript_17631/g.40821  ORF Transcript_17631/g.40821 Transcript_17631/m.40821 type:complete len:333 (+) Transcript_17631:140-1138(+)
MADSSKVLGLPTAHVALLFCFLQLIFCIYALPHASANPIEVGGVLFSPIVQWTLGTYLCILVVTTILAGIGVYYGIASHILIYLVVLSVFAFCDFTGFLIFLAYGSGCKTYHVAGNDTKAEYSCGFWNGTSLFTSFLLILFQIAGIYVFMKAYEEAQREYSRTLMPYLKGVEKAATLNPMSARQMPPDSYGTTGDATGRFGSTMPPSIPPVPAGVGASMRPSAQAAGSVPRAPLSGQSFKPSGTFQAASMTPTSQSSFQPTSMAPTSHSSFQPTSMAPRSQQSLQPTSMVPMSQQSFQPTSMASRSQQSLQPTSMAPRSQPSLQPTSMPPRS